MKKKARTLLHSVGYAARERGLRTDWTAAHKLQDIMYGVRAAQLEPLTAKAVKPKLATGVSTRNQDDAAGPSRFKPQTALAKSSSGTTTRVGPTALQHGKRL